MSDVLESIRAPDTRPSGTRAPGTRPPGTRLRVLARLYMETFVFALAPGVDPGALADPLALRVHPGLPGSGHRSAFGAVLGALGTAPDRMPGFVERDSLAALEDMCTGRLDIVPLMIGQPHGAIANVRSDCGADLAAPAPEIVQRVISTGGGFTAARLPDGLYGAGTPGIDTFGTAVLLVAGPRVDDRLAHDVVQRLLIDLPALRARHPVMRGLDAPDLYPPPGVPAHPGAIKALREVAPPVRR